MKKILFASVAALALTAAAQKAVTFQKDGTVIEGIDLRRTEDGGISVAVYGVNVAGDVALQRQRTCAVTSLTPAQKAALATLRTAALACWNTAEGL